MSDIGPHSRLRALGVRLEQLEEEIQEGSSTLTLRYGAVSITADKADTIEENRHQAHIRLAAVLEQTREEIQKKQRERSLARRDIIKDQYKKPRRGLSAAQRALIRQKAAKRLLEDQDQS